MQMLRAEHIMSTTIDSKSDVGTSVSGQIQKHTPYAAVAKAPLAKSPLTSLTNGLDSDGVNFPLAPSFSPSVSMIGCCVL